MVGKFYEAGGALGAVRGKLCGPGAFGMGPDTPQTPFMRPLLLRAHAHRVGGEPYGQGGVQEVTFRNPSKRFQ